MTFGGRSTRFRSAALLAVVTLAGAPAFAQTTTPSVPMPTVVNPPAGYPYPNVADSPAPSQIVPEVSAPPDGSASPDASASGAPAASGSSAPSVPEADPTSKAPNTYGSGGEPPRLNISSQQRDDSPTMRVGGSYTQRFYEVSLRALGLYRHDAVNVRDHFGKYVSYSGVALQFLPGVSALVHPASGDGDSLIALAPATLSVIGRDGKRASFRSGELIDARGNARVYLVDQRTGGVPLGAYEGPFRLVSPGDKNESRWIRNVVEIDVNR